MKIAIICGIRPQFVKLAPLIQEMKKENIDFDLIHTGQHYDENMSKIFFNELNIAPPKYNLNIGSGTQGYQLGNAIIELDKLFLKNKYNLVIVIGDATPTLSGALVANKYLIPLLHIESGLRSFDKRMPEESNRIIVDHISNYLITSTNTGTKQLLKEGINKENIFELGDITTDILFKNISQIKKIEKQLFKQFNLNSKEKYILVTIHRAENTNDIQNLKKIISAIEKIGEHKKVIFPIHPRTQKIMHDNNISSGNIILLEPQGYFEFIFLLKNASLFITDSGGAQKEAYILGIPTLTCRKSTEWVETVKYKGNIIVNTDKTKIIKYSNLQRGKKVKYNGCFGNGNTTKEIIKLIKKLEFGVVNKLS